VRILFRAGAGRCQGPRRRGRFEVGEFSEIQ